MPRCEICRNFSAIRCILPTSWCNQDTLGYSRRVTRMLRDGFIARMTMPSRVRCAQQKRHFNIRVADANFIFFLTLTSSAKLCVLAPALGSDLLLLYMFIEVLAHCAIRIHPTFPQQKIVDLIRINDLFEVHTLFLQPLRKVGRLAERYVAIVVAVNEQHRRLPRAHAGIR